MLSQKVKEKLETENICNTVIIAVRDDIAEMEREVIKLRRENHSLGIVFTRIRGENEVLKSELSSLEVAVITRDNALLSLEILQRECDKLSKSKLRLLSLLYSHGIFPDECDK